MLRRGASARAAPVLVRPATNAQPRTSPSIQLRTGEAVAALLPRAGRLGHRPREEPMPVETPSIFDDVIQDHLELKRRNSELEPAMPLKRYKSEDPFVNHPLFKTEKQARIEETMDGEESIHADRSASLATEP